MYPNSTPFVRLIAPFLALTTACASTSLRGTPEKPASVVTVCQFQGWDETHQQLFDTGVEYRRQRNVARADLTECQRKLEIRTSTASRINIVKPSGGSFWKSVAVFLTGAIAGGTAVALSK
jgi:hypothetical protein